MKKFSILALLFLLALTWKGQAQDYTQEVTAIQYYFNTDPGTGTAGNGGIIPVTPAENVNEVFNLSLPSLPEGINYLFVRAKDEFGKWSPAERRAFYISGSFSTKDITAVEYFFDSDPGVGNGTVQSVGPASSWSGTLTIALPGNLDEGIHHLFIRTKDSGGTWSVAERRTFYITGSPENSNLVTALEYYYDADPGAGNANPVEIPDGASFSGVVSLGVPCLSEGTHYLYLRARDENGRWSIIGRDTLEAESGIDPTVISPAGPLTFCPTGSVTLSFDSIPGISYQWQKDAVDISGATSASLTITEAGDYQVKAYCGPVFSISNVVQASVLPILTYYADADNDGYGDIASDSLDCTQPMGYVTNSDDCDDSDENVNPYADEVCNGIDDDCDGLTDEDGGQVYYADADLDGYGNPFVSMISCTLPAGYVDNNLDCDDSDENVNPSATEFCNGIDDNCDGNIDEGFVYSVAGASITSSEGMSFCDGTTSTLTVNGGVLGTGADWFWYEGSCGGTSLGSGTSIFISPANGVHQYYVRAEGICNVSDCIAIEITVGDSQPPVISGCPANITLEVEEGQWGAHVSWTPPTASDNCSLDGMASSHDPDDFFNVGTTVVTYTATDEAGNESECQFFVTVTPPNFLGTVNISVISSDITFSENNPEPGNSINVNAVIRNTSNINAGSFEVQFTEQFTNTVYPAFTVPGLNAGQSIVVNEFIAMPNIAAFVPVMVSIDISDNLDESSEGDNTAIRPVICGELAVAGNVDVLASAVPASIPAGSVIQICGSASYDTDPPLADPSVAGAEVVITIDETGQQFMGYTNEDGEFCISYTTPNTPGEYHFTVDITDNTLTGDVSGTFTLTEPVYVCPLDLTVSIQLSGLPANHIVAVGSSFSGTVYVQNNCTAISGQTVLFIAPPAGSSSIAPIIIPPLSPGETYPVPLPSFTLTAPGEFFISATVDYEDDITEDHENNNTAYAVIIVLPPKPDIVAAGGSVLSNLQCFNNNLVSFTVRNTGLVATGEFDCEFNLFINNLFQSTSTVSVSNLDPDQDTLLTFPFTASSAVDTFRFELIADIPDVVDELNEFNNAYSFRQIFRECLPDLVVLGCDFTDVKPADPMVSGNVTVTATIRNQGELPVNEPFDVVFNVGGTSWTETVNVPLAPGQSLPLSVDSPVSTTECATLTIEADPDNDIVEHDEENSYSAPLCYDFVFETINCLGVQIFPGTQYFCDPGTFRIGFWNFGLYEATDFQVKFEISGPGITGWQTLGTESVYAANSCGCPSALGYSGTFYFPQTGTYLVRMTADPDDLYLESDESNNEIILGVNVVESADYEVLSPYIFPSDINPDINEVVSFSVSYTNTGCTGFSPIELFAQMDNDPLDLVIVPPLPSGGWNTVPIPNTWSSAVPGVHVFRAIIDYDEVIAEANELNNEATKAIIVGGAPDYNVLSISVSDDMPELGEVTTINTSVLNEGQSQGTGTLQFLAADGEGNETVLYSVAISIVPGDTEPFTATWLTQFPDARIIARVVNVTPMEFDLSDNEKEIRLNELFIALTGTDVSCHGGNDGEISVNITGGAGPFSFQWSDPALFGQVVNVPAGEYSITVLDDNGLSATASIAISEPDELVASASFTPILCNGGTSTVTVSATGGTLPYSGTGDFVVSAGTHSFTVTDANGCSSVVTVAISEPEALVASTSFTPILCNGGTSTVSVSAASGTLPYSGTGDFIVAAGTHSFTVTDANGCSSVVTVTISEPDALVASAVFTPILCNGGTSTVTVSATGGTLPYSGIGDFIVAAGTHSFTVTDANGCSSVVTVAISEPEALVASAGFTPILCNGGTSTVTVNTTGGTLPYSGTGDFIVAAGTHSFTVTDANGCVSVVTVVISEPEALVASTSFTPILCNGGTSTVSVSATGGTLPYTGTGDFIVAAGTHSFTVIDANGCASVVTVAISEPEALIASASFTPILCNGGTSTVTVSAAGGTLPYSGTGDFIVAAGTHSFTVTDANGCSSEVTVTIAEPEALVLTETHIDASCDNLSDGSVDLGVSGGTSPYFFTWSNGEATEDLTGLEAGTYSVLVTDANNCSATLSVVLTALANATMWYQDADNDGFGNANVNLMSCAQPTGYVTTPGDCNDDNSAVYPGADEVCSNGTDDNCNGLVDEGCDISCNISVNAGADVTTYFGIVSMQQVIRTAQVTGGTPPFTYSWTMDRPLLCNQQNSAGDESFTGGTCIGNTCPTEGSPVENPNCSGSATIYATLLDTAMVCVTVTDANGCSASDCFIVMASDVRCFAGNSGNHKIKVCHKTSSPAKPWVEICIDTNALSTHLAHGDYIGPCEGDKSEEIEAEEEEFNFDFSLFPNPAGDRVTVSFHSHSESAYTIGITDMTGRIVARFKANSFHGDISHEIDLVNVERGIYTVTLTLDGQRMVKKLIRE